MRRTLITLAFAAAFSASSASAAQTPETFAVVGDTVISAAQYESALVRSVRQKFYHGTVPEEKMREHQREVAEALIERELLLAEARRRGMAPDAEKVGAALAEFDQRYGQSAGWQKNRAAMLPDLKRELEARNVLETLERAERAVEAPPEAVARAFYEQKPQLFTQPEQVRLSLILLRVDPSSPHAAWQAALDETNAIRKRIEAGADFAELARLHSNDPSAQRGGDMGYLHEGTMPDPVVHEARSMKAGELSPPVRLLEGYALFRIEDRRPPQLRGFEDVKERASQLWMREESARRWTEFVKGLRRATPVRIDKTRYPALAEALTPVRPAD